MAEPGRSDCDRRAVFGVTDLRVEFEPPAVPGPASYVKDGMQQVVCDQHLAELLSLANDGSSGIRLMVVALDYGLTHLIAEGFPDRLSYA